MSRWYIIRRLRVFIRKRPTVVMLFFGVLMVFAYKELSFFTWGAELKRIILSMLSSEIGGYRMYEEGIIISFIVGRLLFADVCNVFIDLYVANFLLTLKFVKTLVKFFSRLWDGFFRDLRKVKEFVRSIWRRFRVWLDERGFLRPRAFPKVSVPVGVIQNHLNGIAHDPGKAKLRTLFWLCQIPKFIPFPGVPGGVGVAVFVIRYNKYGFKGWLILSGGILVRTATWICIYYLMHRYGLSLGLFYTIFHWILTQ